MALFCVCADFRVLPHSLFTLICLTTWRRLLRYVLNSCSTRLCIFSYHNRVFGSPQTRVLRTDWRQGGPQKS